LPCTKLEAQELARRAKAAMKAAETLPGAGEKARKLKSQADNLRAEAETLKEAPGWKISACG
jgi:hypothetical protein